MKLFSAVMLLPLALAAAATAAAPKQDAPALNVPSTSPAAEDRAGQAPVGEFDAQRSATLQSPLTPKRLKVMGAGKCTRKDRAADPAACPKKETSRPD